MITISPRRSTFFSARPGTPKGGNSRELRGSFSRTPRAGIRRITSSNGCGWRVAGGWNPLCRMQHGARIRPSCSTIQPSTVSSPAAPGHGTSGPNCTRPGEARSYRPRAPAKQPAGHDAPLGRPGTGPVGATGGGAWIGSYRHPARRTRAPGPTAKGVRASGTGSELPKLRPGRATGEPRRQGATPLGPSD